MIPQTNLAADVRGWTAGGSSAVERPSRLVEAIITRTEAMNVDASLLDASNIASLEAEEVAAGWRVARVVDSAEDWGDLLAELLAQSNLTLKPRGSDWRLERARPEVAFGAPAGSLVQSNIYAPPDLRRDSPAPPEERPAGWLVFYGERLGASGYEGVIKAALDFDGLDADTARARWLPSDQTSAAAVFAERLLDAIIRAGERESFEAAWPALAMGWTGDVLALELESGEPATPALVRSLEGAGRDGVALGTEILAPGVACWDDGERAVLQHADRAIYFVIGGQAVASLRADGTLLVRGKIAEGQTLPATSSAIEWNAAQGLLVFSAVDAGPAHTPAFALDASGNLKLAGVLRSRVSLGTRPECLTASGGEIALSLSGGRTLLASNSGDLKFEVAGDVRELCLA
jgi:hypothetical protein